jgi:hypothetical protein
MLRSTPLPGAIAEIIGAKSSARIGGELLTEVSTSPAWIFAFAAGLPDAAAALRCACEATSNAATVPTPSATSAGRLTRLLGRCHSRQYAVQAAEILHFGATRQADECSSPGYRESEEPSPVLPRSNIVTQTYAGPNALPNHFNIRRYAIDYRRLPHSIIATQPRPLADLPTVVLGPISAVVAKGVDDDNSSWRRLSMRRILIATAFLVSIPCWLLSDGEPLVSPAHARAVSICRPPPWFRGLQDVAPFVCGSWWGWPRYYNQEFGIRHRPRHRDP